MRRGPAIEGRRLRRRGPGLVGGGDRWFLDPAKSPEPPEPSLIEVSLGFSLSRVLKPDVYSVNQELCGVTARLGVFGCFYTSN